MDRQNLLNNVQTIRTQLSQNLNDPAGAIGRGKDRKEFTIDHVLSSVEKLGDQYKTLSEMYESAGFGPQNQVWMGVKLMLESMGTPVKSFTTKKNPKFSKMAGTNAVLQMLQANNLSLPVKSTK